MVLIVIVLTDTLIVIMVVHKLQTNHPQHHVDHITYMNSLDGDGVEKLVMVAV